jgi:hypothetical protein
VALDLGLALRVGQPSVRARLVHPLQDPRLDVRTRQRRVLGLVL